MRETVEALERLLASGTEPGPESVRRAQIVTAVSLARIADALEGPAAHAGSPGYGLQDLMLDESQHDAGLSR